MQTYVPVKVYLFLQILMSVKTAMEVVIITVPTL